MRKAGSLLLQLSACMILAGGTVDLTLSFLSHFLPETHLMYIKLKSAAVSQELVAMDHAFMRVIGGCLIGIGIGALSIIYAALEKRRTGPLAALLCMVTVAEGMNAAQLLYIHSSLFFFLLACVISMWTGGVLWWRKLAFACS